MTPQELVNKARAEGKLLRPKNFALDARFTPAEVEDGIAAGAHFVNDMELCEPRPMPGMPVPYLKPAPVDEDAMRKAMLRDFLACAACFYFIAGVFVWLYLRRDTNIFDRILAEALR